MITTRRQYLKTALYSALLIIVLLVFKTISDVKAPTLSLRNINTAAQRFQVLDRYGQPLGISYQNGFNTLNIVPLYEVPELLRRAIITSEDRRFFEHHGADWRSRMGALWQNIKARRALRGASTITEQVVRIVHPRPRNIWSRWIEGFEAILLERRASKGEILEFYLNQVPYAANRRGVAQAARYYFNRDLDTLTHKEMLVLALLPRAPSALDLYKNPDAIEAAVRRLAENMLSRGELQASDYDQLLAEKLVLEPASHTSRASHFINYIRETVPYNLSTDGVLLTTLDGALQHKAQKLLDERISALRGKKVHNGALLVVDHTNGEMLAWAVGGDSEDALKDKTPAAAIDAVRVPRQPGSSLKPFLYALALDSGWSAATELDDEPISEAIGAGLHEFHNYSHTFYGKISLREALGNSLNIPALQTIGFVSPSRYLDILHDLGFSSLAKPAEFYKDGLALGNGEVSLFEMVQGYSALANNGVFRPLASLLHNPLMRESRRVYSAESASIIANILSDPYARRREFGAGSVLNLPVQTAVKTGTSTDYRDAWVMGFNSRYVVGVWLGNLDQVPMDGVTGSVGPALIMRGIFAELSAREKLRPLYLSPKLTQMEVCTDYENKNNQNCFPRTEYFIAGTEPLHQEEKSLEITKNIKLTRPTNGLKIAYDPRIPQSLQAFEFIADCSKLSDCRLEWLLNGKPLAKTIGGRFLWPVERGQHKLIVNALGDDEKVLSSDMVNFQVK